MSNFIYVIKDITTVVGCLISCITLTTLFIKPIRKWVIDRVVKVTHTEEINNQNKIISQHTEQISGLRSSIDQVVQILNEVKSDIHDNEKNRLRNELFNYGNRCRRGIALFYEEWEYIRIIGDRYLHRLNENSIGEDEYNFIRDYYYSDENQDKIKQKNK